MFVDVIILYKFEGNNKTWTYQVSSEQASQLTFSSLVVVDYNNRKYLAFVKDIHNNQPEANSIKIKPIESILVNRSLNKYQQFLLKHLSINTITSLFELVNLFINPTLFKALVNQKKIEQEVLITDTDHIVLNKTNIKKYKIDENKLNDGRNNGQVVTRIKSNHIYYGKVLKTNHRPEIILCPNDDVVSQVTKQLIDKDTTFATIKDKDNINTYSLIYKLVKDNQIDLIVGTYRALFLPFNQMPVIMMINASDKNYNRDDNPYINIKELLDKSRLEVNSIDNYPLINNLDHQRNIQVAVNQLQLNDPQLINIIKETLKVGNICIYHPTNHQQVYMCPQCKYVSTTPGVCPEGCEYCLQKVEDEMQEFISRLQLDYKVTSDIDELQKQGTVFVTDNILLPIINFDLTLTYMLDPTLRINNIFNSLDHMRTYNYLASYSKQIINILSYPPHKVVEEVNYISSAKYIKTMLLTQNKNKLPNLFILYVYDKTHQGCKYSYHKIIKYLNKHKINVYYKEYIYKHKNKYYQQLLVQTENDKLLRQLIIDAKVDVRKIYY